MRVYVSFVVDLGFSKVISRNCVTRIMTAKLLSSYCAYIGIIMCSSMLWEVEAFQAILGASNIKPHHSAADGLLTDDQYFESSTTGMRQRSADITTGDTWSVTGEHVMPTFDESTSRNVTTQLGQTAYLSCIVNNLGDKTVSWIRRKDFHVLTVGMDIYTSDVRFQAIHVQDKNDWSLQIKFVQLLDEGVYECQVSSDPKISYFVNLTVLVAKAAIEGTPDIYVKTGSSINLTCVITQSPVAPVFVFWYHDDRMINYDPSRGDTAISKAGADTAISKLHIKDVQPSDSGNYTCAPSNTEATSITVHVLNGEKPAAMQHDANPGHSSADLNHQHYFTCMVSILFWLVWR